MTTQSIVAKNVLGTPLRACCMQPITGYTRNGFCDFYATDPGQHTVCAVMTADFLQFSASVGNDLSTPVPDFNFPGLKAGDKWCLCALRWKEAYDAGHAPQLVLSATHESFLTIVPLDTLREFAVDL